MQLADFDAVLNQCAESVLRFLELDRQVARVIVYSQMLPQSRVVRMLRPESVEEMNHFAARFQQTKRLRLEPEMQPAASLARHSRNVFHAMP